MKRVLLFALSFMLTLSVGCIPRAPKAPVLPGDNSTGADPNPPTDAEPEINYNENATIATMVIKEYGTIIMELYPDVAPQSVCNFVTLARAGFYDGLIFHRVISGFMIQGGDPDGNGGGGPGYMIKGEFAINGVDNPISHERGVVSMARRGDPYYNSAGSQFFIVHQDSTFLDGSYAAFGRVISGMDVVDAIAAVNTNRNDKPLTDVVIESITIDGPEYPAPEKFK